MPAPKRPARAAKTRAPRAVPKVTTDETDVASLRMLLTPLQVQADLLERVQRIHQLPGDAPSPIPGLGVDGAASIDDARAALEDRMQRVLDDFPQRIIDLLEEPTEP